MNSIWYIFNHIELKKGHYGPSLGTLLPSAIAPGILAGEWIQL